MCRWMIGMMAVALCGACAASLAEQAAPLEALARMPVKEITVFKDGHAFVLHEGKMPVDTRGNVQMDYLPMPVLGTFWPYSAGKNVKLSAVTASPRRVLVERTALSLRELLEANTGAQVSVLEQNNTRYDAEILGFPTRSGEELQATGPPNSGEQLPQKGNVILLKRAEGIAVVNIDQIKEVTFKGEPKPKLAGEEFRNLLTLQLEWPDNRPGKTADVGMVYLQKGVRWIPGYKITLDGRGNARIRLQATLINELTDLEDVTAHLVIGVPTFAFQDTIDPISLQQAFAQLSSYFQADSRSAYALSNALMTQAARMGERVGGMGGGAFRDGGGRPEAPGVPGPEVSASEKNEDLFLFTVRHITLRKGQRMVLPVAEYTLKYRDVFTLDMPLAPPPEVQANVSTEQQAEIARLLSAPKVMHKIRLTNKSAYPLTTAPALIVKDDRVLAQGIMTYTAIGGEAELAITVAGDIKVDRTEKETGRTPNAMEWQGSKFARVDLTGTLVLTNHREEAVELEVTRSVLGHVDKADNNGSAVMVNLYDSSGAVRGDYPYWWNRYSWPGWWHHLNGLGRFTWKLKLDAGKSISLNYSWHYFWQ